MIREYVVNKKNKNSLGLVALSTKVFESIVFFALEDNPNVKLCVSTHLYRPISCKVNDGVITLKCDVIFKVGCNVPEVCNGVLKEMHYAIKKMTGYDNTIIDLNVRGFYL